MKIKLPPKKDMKEVLATDPRQEIYSLERYYSKIWKHIFLKRFKIAFNLMRENNFENLLDIGFGSGIFLPALSSKTKNLYGIDIHAPLNAVEIMANKNGVLPRLAKGDILNIPFPCNKFDGVFCLSVLEFVEDAEKAISEIFRVSRPGAKIIIGAPVQNKITEVCYKIIGKNNQDKKHKSNHNKIIKSVKKHFRIKKIAKIPAFLPLNLSLFFVISAEKI